MSVNMVTSSMSLKINDHADERPGVSEMTGCKPPCDDPFQTLNRPCESDSTCESRIVDFLDF
jgi:hypothetical protein